MDTEETALTPEQERIEKLLDALRWCSGSADFGEGGQAREGWLILVQPLFDKNDPCPNRASW